jgi:F-type H+-transporting ATPase subunit delta
MLAVSRQSYAAAEQRLLAFSATAPPEKVADVADEILAVGRLLAGQPQLRRALANATRSGEERVALLRSLLQGKIDDDALDLVGALVAGRWPLPGELLDGVERLGVDALMASAERADSLAEVEDELFRFAQIVAGDPQLAAALSDATADLDRRAELVRSLLQGKASRVTVRLAELALTGFGGRGFQASLGRLVELTAARRDREVAYVLAAVPLSDDEERRLAARLAEMYGRGVSLKIEIKPEIIGGMSVRVGADLYDGTILRRLTQARQAFAK